MVITKYVINHLYKIINLHHVVQLQKRHKGAKPRSMSFYTFLSLTTFINLHHVVQLQKRHKGAKPRSMSFYTFLSLTTYNLVILVL